MNDDFFVEVDFHKEIDNGIRVKVRLPRLGLYLNGVRVFRPTADKDWAVYPASTWVGNRWARMTEFDTKLPLWQAIRTACIEATEGHHDVVSKQPKRRDEVDEIMSDEDYQKALDALPFD